MVPTLYIPWVSDAVKLKAPGAYRKYGLSDEAWLRVTDVPGYRVDEDGTPFIAEGEAAVIHVEVLCGVEPTGRCLNVEIADLLPPASWRPVYRLTVQEETAKDLHRWLADGRGVKVWGGWGERYTGPLYFTPGDANPPHWSPDWFEIIHDPNRLEIRLVRKPGAAKETASAGGTGAP